MQTKNQNENLELYLMTEESIEAFIQYEIDRGASQDSIRYLKRFTSSLFEWLPEKKIITQELLLAWRQSLKDRGYTAQTEQNYIKGINRYLDYVGYSDIRFNKGKARDIAGKQFGYLVAIEPTGEKNRKDILWRCECHCGKEAVYTATQLLTGRALSCGCLKIEQLKNYNKYIDGTSLRQSLEDQIYSKRSPSGYTGVTEKRGKWHAYIKYKGQRFSLGSYSDLNDAVKARARGKELVIMDAMGLLNFYEELHKDDPEQPSRAKVKSENKQLKKEKVPSDILPATRSNNTSGYPGVHRKRKKWEARITYKKITYNLGVFENNEDALNARKEAEEQLRKNPDQFLQWVQQRRKEVTKE